MSFATTVRRRIDDKSRRDRNSSPPVRISDSRSALESEIILARGRSERFIVDLANLPVPVSVVWWRKVSNSRSALESENINMKTDERVISALADLLMLNSILRRINAPGYSAPSRLAPARHSGTLRTLPTMPGSGKRQARIFDYADDPDRFQAFRVNILFARGISTEIRPPFQQSARRHSRIPNTVLGARESPYGVERCYCWRLDWLATETLLRRTRMLYGRRKVPIRVSGLAESEWRYDDARECAPSRFRWRNGLE